MLTKVQVTLDGRVLVFRGRNALELASVAETREIIAALDEAMAEQIAIVGDDAPAPAYAELDR
jgi:hypothetical protein